MTLSNTVLCKSLRPHEMCCFGVLVMTSIALPKNNSNRGLRLLHCTVYQAFFLVSFAFLIPSLSLFWLYPPPLLLSRQRFSKQSSGSEMLLNGCILLAGSEQAVCRGACQLLALGCCSMWKQWEESAFDASPTWFSLFALLFSLWWSSVNCSWATGGRHINTHAQGKRDEHTHAVQS